MSQVLGFRSLSIISPSIGLEIDPGGNLCESRPPRNPLGETLGANPFDKDAFFRQLIHAKLIVGVKEKRGLEPEGDG